MFQDTNLCEDHELNLWKGEKHQLQRKTLDWHFGIDSKAQPLTQIGWRGGEEEDCIPIH